MSSPPGSLFYEVYRLKKFAESMMDSMGLDQVGLPFQEDREADQQPDDHEELGECPETSSHPTCPTSQPQNLSLTGISNTVPPETAMSPPLRRPASAMSPPLSAMSPVSTIPDISAREMYTAEPPYCESPVVSMATAPPPSECVSMVTESGCVSMVTAAGDGGDDTEDDACTIRDEAVSEGSVKGKMVAVPHDGESHLEENTANLEAEIIVKGNEGQMTLKESLTNFYTNKLRNPFHHRDLEVTVDVERTVVEAIKQVLSRDYWKTTIALIFLFGLHRLVETGLIFGSKKMKINVTKGIAILSLTVGAILAFCTYCDYYWLLEIKLGLLRVFVSGQDQIFSVLIPSVYPTRIRTTASGLVRSVGICLASTGPYLTIWFFHNVSIKWALILHCVIYVGRIPLSLLVRKPQLPGETEVEDGKQECSAECCGFRCCCFAVGQALGSRKSPWRALGPFVFLTESQEHDAPSALSKHFYKRALPQSIPVQVSLSLFLPPSISISISLSHPPSQSRSQFFEANRIVVLCFVSPLPSPTATISFSYNKGIALRAREHEGRDVPKAKEASASVLVNNVEINFRNPYGADAYRIMGTQVQIFTTQEEWHTCGTVSEYDSSHSYTISCPSNIIATKLKLFDDTIAEIGDKNDGVPIMIIKELTVNGNQGEFVNCYHLSQSSIKLLSSPS
eukprot:sb/3462700/